MSMWQVTDVVDVQDDVGQALNPTNVEGVGSSVQKLTPARLTAELPVMGELGGSIAVVIGMSNVKNAVIVAMS